jgi:hypothetical protein
MPFIRPLSLAIILFASAVVMPKTGAAQDMGMRFGIGFNALVSTVDGVGVGLRTRLSAPVNPDLSFALDLGGTGFIFRGRDEANYVVEPQVSVIVNLPARGDRLPYILAGAGAYLPTSDRAEAGPTIHLGYGFAQLLYETAIFYEINPALIVGRDRVHLAIPVRIGLIF